MKLFIPIIVLFFITASGNSQIDTGIKVPSFGASGTSISPNKNSSFDSAINFSPKYKVGEDPAPEPLIENKKPDMTKNDGLMKPEHDYKPKWLEKDNETKAEYKKSQYFGDFKTKTRKVRILCRDHEYVDGDRVRIYNNDKIIVNDIYLDSGFKEFFVELETGFNKIEFMALNQGSSGPNTAEFKVLDENGNLMTGNVWNLATGVKASLIIIRE